MQCEKSKHPVAVRGREADETFLYIRFDEVVSLVMPVVDSAIGVFISSGQESRYKARLIEQFEDCGFVAYCIENEEKEPGWPDVLVTHALDNRFLLVETKVSDKNGVIKFEQTQPLFYVRNEAKLPIHIYAFDVRYQRTVIVPPIVIIKNRSLRYKLPDIADATYRFGIHGYSEVCR